VISNKKQGTRNDKVGGLMARATATARGLPEPGEHIEEGEGTRD
jgi:hypothetical protein